MNAVWTAVIALVGLLLIAAKRLPPTEQKIIGAWSWTYIEGVGRIIFSADHKVREGFPPSNKDGRTSGNDEFDIVRSGRWWLEGKTLVTEMDNSPLIKAIERLDPSNRPAFERKVQKRKMARIENDKIVFDDGSSLNREARLTQLGTSAFPNRSNRRTQFVTSARPTPAVQAYDRLIPPANNPRAKADVGISSLALLSAVDSSRVKTLPSWIRRSTAIYSAEIPKGPFMLETIGAERGRPVATGTYDSHRSTDLMVPIEGTLTPDNRFWPTAEVEVAADLDSPWQPVAPAPLDGQNKIYTVRYDAPMTTLHFDLRPLLPFVDSMRFARLSLKTGESSILLLDDLVNLAKGSDNSAEEIAIYCGVYEPEVKPPFILSRAESTATNSEGVFAYGTLDGPPVELEGTKTEDGEFWLTAECEVSNELDGEWQIIGTTSRDGQLSRLEIPANEINGDIHVNLDRFRPFVGRYRYGRVTTPAGVSAQFKLTRLLPRSGLAIRQ